MTRRGSRGHPIEQSKHISFFNNPGNLLTIPLCYRSPDGKWVGDDGYGAILLDRLRLVKLIEGALLRRYCRRRRDLPAETDEGDGLRCEIMLGLASYELKISRTVQPCSRRFLQEHAQRAERSKALSCGDERRAQSIHHEHSVAARSQFCFQSNTVIVFRKVDQKENQEREIGLQRC
jgi:hypothetical protein